MEKNTTEITSNSNSSLSNKDLEATSGINQDEHLELKHHTIEEIEASGHWYDKLIKFLELNSVFQVP